MAKQAQCRVIQAEFNGNHADFKSLDELDLWLEEQGIEMDDSGDVYVRNRVAEAINDGRRYVVIPVSLTQDATFDLDYATKHTVAEFKAWMLGNDKPSKNYPYWMNERIIAGVEYNVDNIHEDDRFVITDKQIDSLKNWVAKMKDTYLR